MKYWGGGSLGGSGACSPGNLYQFISKRQSSLARFGKYSHSFKFWRSKVQAEIRTCKESHYKYKVYNMKHHDICKWWKENLAMVLAKQNGVNK